MKYGPDKLPKRLFSDEEVTKIRELREQNFSATRIAQDIARDKRLVSLFLYKPEEYEELEVLKKQQELQPPRGTLNKTISKNKSNKKLVNAASRQFALKQTNRPSQLSASQDKITVVYKNYQPASLFNDEEEARVSELREQGLSFKQIGRELGKDRRVVSFFINAPELYAINKRGEKHSQNPVKIPNHRRSEGSTSVAAPVPPKTIDPNKISLEHRAVIKFLTKKGLTSPDIYDDMEEIYGKLNFDVEGLDFWHQQYAMGRETLLNDSRATNEFILPTTSPNSSEFKSKSSPTHENVKFKIKFGFGKKPVKS